MQLTGKIVLGALIALVASSSRKGPQAEDVQVLDQAS